MRLWFGTSRQYTATSILRISTGRSTVLNSNDHGEAVATFDIFQRTQRQYIRNRDSDLGAAARGGRGEA